MDVFHGIPGAQPLHVQVTKALDALLVGLSEVAKKASEALGEGATEAQIVDRTIKLFLGGRSGVQQYQTYVTWI